jgi:MFS family permease
MYDQESASKPIRNILTRDFILCFLTFFSFLFAYFALIPTLPLYLARLGSQSGEIGFLVGIFSVASLFCRFLAGNTLSRYSEKNLMMFAALLFAVTFLACIILRPFWPFLAVRLFQGVTYAYLDTAVFAWLLRVAPPAYRGRLLGYFMLAPGLAMVMAPSFGMFLVNRFSFIVLFMSCMVLSLCALLFSGMLKAREIATPAAGSSTHNSSFVEHKIIVPAIVGFFYNFVLGSIMTFFSLYAIECGVPNPGYFFSAAAFTTIAGRFLAGKILDTWGNEKTILIFTLTSMAAMLILSFSRTLPMFIFVGLLWGVGAAYMFPVSMAYAMDYVGSSTGPAVGTFRAVMDLGIATGPMVMGMIIPTIGYPGMFLCLAVVCLVNLCYFQFYVRKRG